MLAGDMIAAVLAAGSEAEGLGKSICFDFITSVVLILLSLAVMFESIRMAADVGGFLYASPGMMPMVLAILLLFTGVLLLKRSVRDRGAGQHCVDFAQWVHTFCKSKPAQEMLTGGLALALYTFVLLPRLPFVVSTAIFLMFVMGMLNATSLVKNALITAGVVGGIYAVFQLIFHVPLP